MHSEIKRLHIHTNGKMINCKNKYAFTEQIYILPASITATAVKLTAYPVKSILILTNIKACLASIQMLNKISVGHDEVLTTVATNCEPNMEMRSTEWHSVRGPCGLLACCR